MAKFQVELNDFSGAYAAGVPLPDQPANSWTGRDMLVTPSGLLVPRRRAALDTGNATGNETLGAGETAEAGFCLGSITGNSVHEMVYCLTTTTPTYTAYQFRDDGDGTFTYVRSFTLGGRMAKACVVNVDPTTGDQILRWIRWPASATIERINLTAGGAPLTNAIPAACNADTLAVWGSRLVAASSATPGRIYYSGAATWTFAANDYIDTQVTNFELIYAIVPTADALWLARPSGWTVLSGSPVSINTLQVRTLDHGAGLAELGADAHNIGGRIIYSGNKPGIFLRERLASQVRDLGSTVEGDESEGFVRRGPMFTVSAPGVYRLEGDGVAMGTIGLPVIGSAGTDDLVVWKDGRFSRHVFDTTKDGFGSGASIANGWPSSDMAGAVRGFALRQSDNKVAPWALPLVERRPTYWSGAAIEGVWRSAPIAGPRPGEPFKVLGVLVEVYKFRGAAENDSSTSWGSGTVKARVWGEWAADLSANDTAALASTELTWSQPAADVPKDWQREMLRFNCNDLPSVYRVVVQLKVTMVAVRRVILVGEHTGVQF